MPAVIGRRAPMRGTRAPLSGDSTRNITDDGISTAPAWVAE
jgi:hypothetical protein